MMTAINAFMLVSGALEQLDRCAADHILSARLRQSRRRALNDGGWQQLDNTALERLLVERWLFRGALLAATAGAAGLTTYLGMRGLTTFADRLEVAALGLFTLSSGVSLFVMRRHDLSIHRELQRRRKA
jgi:hypothetical protein